MSNPARRVAAGVAHWLADRCDYRAQGSHVLRPRYWLHRLLGRRVRSVATGLEGGDD